MTNARARAAAALLAISVAAGCAQESPTGPTPPLPPFAPTFTEGTGTPNGFGLGSGGRSAATSVATSEGETATLQRGGMTYGSGN